MKCNNQIHFFNLIVIITCFYDFIVKMHGSLGIAPTRNCTFLNLDSWSPGAGFYFYTIHQRNKSDKERKIVRRKISFMLAKRFNTFLKRWVLFRVGEIPRLPVWISGYLKAKYFFYVIGVFSIQILLKVITSLKFHVVFGFLRSFLWWLRQW